MLASVGPDSQSLLLHPKIEVNAAITKNHFFFFFLERERIDPEDKELAENSTISPKPHILNMTIFINP